MKLAVSETMKKQNKCIAQQSLSEFNIKLIASE